MTVVRQQALSVVAPILAGREAALDRWLRDNKRNLQRALARSSTTHFARWVVVPPSRGEAGEVIGERFLLAFETNFDGELQDHLADLRAALGELLDQAFAGVEGYPGAERLPELAAFVRQASRRSAAYFVAHPGLSVAVVHGDARLKTAAEQRLRELSQGARVVASVALPLAQELQRVARGLAQQEGLALGPVDRGLREQPGVLERAFMRPFAVVLAFVLAPFFEWRDERVRKHQPSFESAELRAKRDSIGLEEDRVDQNGLTHLVPIKPGWYRTFALGVMVHLVTALSDAGALVGRLGGIQTIHFARWVVLSDRRLLFFSNYDGSWEAYLGDFVDKASLGLTMIWSNTLWYPKTRFLLFKGAKDEEAFKAWTRAHQLPTQVWYSAYPTLSVGDVLKNAKVRELLGSELSTSSAEQLLALL